MTRRLDGPGFRRLPRIGDQMTSDLLACVERSTAAERAGDAHEALEWHQAVPMFRRGRHRAVLQRLAALGDDLPPWVWARWAVYQATRCEAPDSATGDLHGAALRLVVESVHADLLEGCRQHGGDPVQVAARVLGESWAFHQFFAYERGGLAAFMDEFATGRLEERAGLVRQWAVARLGGYRVGSSLPEGRLRVHDAALDSCTEVLDLGASSSAGVGGWVVGRLVPSGIDDLLMFDTPPLPVPREIAAQVAASQGHEAWSSLREAVDDERFDPLRFLREDYELTTDVQELHLLRFGTPSRDLERIMRQLREGRDEVGRAACRILRRACEGEVVEGDAAYVAAAALNPYAAEEVRRSGGRRVRALESWADLVPDPGRARLRQLAGAGGV